MRSNRCTSESRTLNRIGLGFSNNRRTKNLFWVHTLSVIFGFGIIFLNFVLYIFKTGLIWNWIQNVIYNWFSLKKDKYRRESKCLCCWLGDVLECRTIYLAARMSWSFWENIYFGRVMVWYGVNRKIIHFSNTSILPSSRYFIHPIFQIILVKKSLCGRWSPKQQRRPFAFSSVFVFILCCLLSLNELEKRTLSSPDVPKCFHVQNISARLWCA